MKRSEIKQFYMDAIDNMCLRAKKAYLTRLINQHIETLADSKQMLLNGSKYYLGSPIYIFRFNVKKDLQVLQNLRNELNTIL